MERARIPSRSRPFGLRLLALAVGASLSCPAAQQQEAGQPQPVDSAPFELPTPAAPLASALRSAIPAPQLSLASASRVSVGVSFQASELFWDTSYIPPDTMGAVGPTQIVEMINGNFEVFDKTGASLLRISLDDFWYYAGAPVRNGDSFDPRIVFDPASGRFFASSIDRDYGSGNFVYLARSDGADATADWDAVIFEADTVPPAEFHDFDTLALDADGVYVCTDGLLPTTGFVGAKSCYSIPKADLLLDDPTLANMTRFEGSPPELPLVWGSLQPALDFGPSDGRTPLLGLTFGVTGSLLRGDIFDTVGPAATLGGVETIAGDPGYAIWAGARQPPPSVGRRQSIENFGGRIQSNVVQQGESLWAVHSVKGTGNNAAVRWYEIHEPTNTMLQTGLIDDPLQDFIEPSIAVNASGQVVIGYTCTGPSLAASACVSAGETVAGVTEFDPPLLLREGAGYYYQDYGTRRNRWGDYSATVVDPVDSCSFWTFQEFVAVAAVGEVGPWPLPGGGQWGTQVTQLVFSSCSATIHVAKTADDDPDGAFDDDPSGWRFEVTTGVAQQATTDASGQLTFEAPSGVVSVAESSGAVAGTGLWLVNASCVDDGSGLPVGGEAVDEPLGPASASVGVDIELAAGASVTCTFRNQRMAGSITGGGQIRDAATGRRVSFQGSAALALDGTKSGEFEATFHDVGIASLSGRRFLGTQVERLAFSSDESEQPPDPPHALFNEAALRVSGDLEGAWCELSVQATDHGESSSGGPDADSIRLGLDCPGVALDYDSWNDFPVEEQVGLHRLDSGNLQIHPPE